MTITFALMRYFVASFLVGVGIGLVLGHVARLARNLTNTND